MRHSWSQWQYGTVSYRYGTDSIDKVLENKIILVESCCGASREPCKVKLILERGVSLKFKTLTVSDSVMQLVAPWRTCKNE